MYVKSKSTVSESVSQSVSESVTRSPIELLWTAKKRCHDQVEGYGDQFEKMQIWIQIRDSVGFMFRAGENPVEVKHIRN